MKRKLNWKIAFISLLALNIAAFLTLIIMFVIPPGDRTDFDQNNNTRGNASLRIETNKNDLNSFINYYIEQKLEEGAIKYQVFLDEYVHLQGILPVFDEAIEMNMTFEPKALANGDIILTQKTVSVGQLTLPVSYVMNFLAKMYDFPGWVEIFPNEKIIYLHLTDIKLSNNMRIYANEFDLKSDKISFTLEMNE